jgi:hypothetical protein
MPSPGGQIKQDGSSLACGPWWDVVATTLLWVSFGSRCAGSRKPDPRMIWPYPDGQPVTWLLSR